MIASIAAIAGGGALGAVLRHGANQGSMHYFGVGYPFGTIGVNILVSFIMGVLIAYFAHVWQPSPEVKAFLVTGLLGAFTTFSTFSLDFITLWERGDQMAAFVYVLASVFFAIGALMLGMAIIRWVFL
jgi:CrcB protein